MSKWSDTMGFFGLRLRTSRRITMIPRPQNPPLQLVYSHFHKDCLFFSIKTKLIPNAENKDRIGAFWIRNWNLSHFKISCERQSTFLWESLNSKCIPLAESHNRIMACPLVKSRETRNRSLPPKPLIWR